MNNWSTWYIHSSSIKTVKQRLLRTNFDEVMKTSNGSLIIVQISGNENTQTQYPTLEYSAHVYPSAMIW